jgi:DNA-binding MarR family transcriptional regulator
VTAGVEVVRQLQKKPPGLREKGERQIRKEKTRHVHDTPYPIKNSTYLARGLAMSIKVMSRVWAYSRCTGTDLVTVLALADWADDDGWSWPSLPQLARKSRVTIGQICKILTAIEQAGELHRERSSGGRRRRTRYRVTLSENSLVENTVTGNSVAENTLIQASKTLSPVRGALNRHRTVNKNNSARKARGSDPRVTALIHAFADKFLKTVGKAYQPVWGKDGAHLKRLLATGEEPAEIEKVMDRYFEDDFYRRTGFDVSRFAGAFNAINSAHTESIYESTLRRANAILEKQTSQKAR